MVTYTAQCSQIGSFSYAKYFTLYVVVTDRDGNPDTNKSYVDYNVYCQSSGSGSLSANHQLYFELGGNIIRNENVYVNVKSPNAYIAIASGTLEVPHNDDGSKEIWVGASISATGGYGVSASVGTLFTLSTIPRASSVSCTTANIEETAIINVSSASSNFRHNITASFGSETISIASNTAGGTTSWTIPSSFYAQIPNSKTGAGTITCDTYNNGSFIGRKTTTLNVTTSEEKCKPSLSATVIDTNQNTIALTGTNTKLIKYNSTAKVTITASAKNSSSVSSKKVNNTTVSGDSISIQKIETDTFVVTVTDSRGYSNSVTLKPTVINYMPLTINATIKRTQPTTGEVDIVFSGNYFNGNLGSVNNTLSINWKYKESNSSTWINGGNITATINNNTYSNGNTAISLGKVFDYQKSYNFMLEVTDKLTTLQPTYTVTQGIPIFNWSKDFVNIFGTLKIKEQNILELMFPIGSTYITQENINPVGILGFGTWERTKGKVLVGLDENQTEFNEIGKTGGEKEHKLTIAEMPSHNHGAVDLNGNAISATTMKDGGSNDISQTSGNKSYVYMGIGFTGGSQAHNNLQPYEVVGYMWIRRS